MNGDGWICDECGKVEVIPDVNRFVMNGSTIPPEGWYVLAKSPAPIREASNQRWEFCSIECIHAQTKPQGPMRYEDPTDRAIEDMPR